MIALLFPIPVNVTNMPNKAMDGMVYKKLVTVNTTLATTLLLVIMTPVNNPITVITHTAVIVIPIC